MATNTVIYKRIDTFARKHMVPDLLLGNVFKQAHPLLDELMKRKKVHGGSGVEWPVEYAENPNFGTIGRMGQFASEDYDSFTKGQLDWTNYYVNVLVSGQDIRAASGRPEKIFDVVEAQIRNGLETARKNIAKDLYSDGSVIAHGSRGRTRGRITGLAGICTAGVTYAGLTRSATVNTWWQPYNADLASASYANLIDPTNSYYLLAQINSAQQTAGNGTDLTDIMFCDPYTYAIMLNIFNARQYVYNKATLGELGWKGIEFNGQKIFPDKNMTFTAPTAGSSGTGRGIMFGLNSQYLELHLQTGAAGDWTGLNPIPNNEGRSGQFLFSAQLICRQPGKQWMLTSIPLS